MRSTFTRQLLFLPGAGADPDFWRPVGELLPKSWRKVFFGWPGLGRQPPDPAVNSLDDLVAIVEAELGDGPADLLAQSLGGVIAMRVALRQPAKVRRIVLAATSGGIDAARREGIDWRPDYRRLFPEARLSIMDSDVDLTRELKRVQQPTLLLWGDADPISPLAVGERLRALLPNAELSVVPGGDHGFVQDRPQEVAGLVARHLA